ncbi:MAG: insulinase family protein [Arenimonas sp.]|nr:insulinase family protein [Arenimonas sp.]
MHAARHYSVLALAIALAFSGSIATTTSATAATTSAEIDIPYEQFTLPNGLRVIVHTDRKAPIVAVNIWYHVGSKNEPVGRTGFAHLFEHLMFQSSENHPGEFFTPFELVGATDQNGTTSNDRTNYFQNVPTTALDMALWMESDRMGHLLGAIDQADLDEQRGVVQNEKRQRENQPYGRAWEIIFSANFPVGHPYHHSVIGSMNDLNAATLTDVKDWFKNWYGPNNAVLVLAGDIDLATAKAKALEYFGDIPASATVKKMPPMIDKRTSSSRATITDQVPQTRIYRTWNIPAVDADATDRMNLVSQILGGSRSSRLDKRLVFEDKLADSVSAFAYSMELGGLFIVQVDVKQGVDPAKVEKALNEELNRLISTGPTEAELAQAKTVIKAGFIRGVERIGGFGGKADVLAECAVFTGNPSCFAKTLSIINQTTVKEVQATAAEWLSTGDYTLTMVPGDREPAVEVPAVTNLKPAVILPADPNYITVPSKINRSLGVPKTDRFPSLEFPDQHRATLSNGTKVILVERPGLPIVQINTVFEGAGFASDSGGKDGLASFTMGMMDEGSGQLGALAFADRAESLGAIINTGSTLDTSSISLSALNENLDASLALYADVLLKPRFDQAEIDRVRASWIAQIKQEKAVPTGIGGRVLRKQVYGTGHPYAVPASGLGEEISIASLSQADMQAWHAHYLRPDNATIIVVGDTTLKDMLPKLETTFGNRKVPTTAKPSAKVPVVALPSQNRVILIDQPGAVQANILIGQLVPSSMNEQATEFEIANSVLGGEFSSRLNMNLREAKHWAYGSYSGVGGAIGQRLWTAQAAVQIDKTVESLQELMREIDTYAQGSAPATAMELDKIKATEIRSLPGSFETAGAVLASIAGNVRYNRPDDYQTQRANLIANLTLEQVNAAAKTIQPESLTIVVVGDFSLIKEKVKALNIGPVSLFDKDGNAVK